MAADHASRGRSLRSVVLSLATGSLLAQTPEMPPPEMPVKPAQDRQGPVGGQGPLRNRLGDETSPYLRQHRDNPVAWLPWGEEAFARARELDRPIFLSIGYAACHWCHVMAHESFADARIAALMNAHFVCVKVDREERPDLDEIYLAAVQAMGIGGGWPLSVWLTPDGRPFYGGTYFPPEDRYGRRGFPAVLESIAAAWRDSRAEVQQGAAELTAHLQEVLAPEARPGEPTPGLLAAFLPQSRARYDAEHGGFAPPPRFAPKFPHASELMVLMQLAGEEPAAMVTRTLDAMRGGGMYDQLGGGFHRYSTDREWLVPHFEKMLYDNAQLAACYLADHLRTGNEDRARVARETLDYLLREMRHERGGFYSSQDADSEGEEGRYFVWGADAFDAVLGDDAAFGRRCFGVTDAGNWEGTNVLVRARTEAELATDEVGGAAGVRARFARVRDRLLAVRGERERPGTDDKILCAWNGLAIAAFADGHRVLGEPRYLAAAQAAAAFVLDELVQDGRCRRSWHSGRAQHAGYLEDHALLADALLALFECDADPRWLGAARQLLRTIDAHFGAADGGFWFTADDHESLLARTKVAVESSTPAGAAVATRAFLRAGLLLGDEALYDRGVRALRQAHAMLAHSPVAAPTMVGALQLHLADPALVIVAGEPADARTGALLARARRSFPAHHVTALVTAANREALAALSAVFADKAPIDGAPAAYVCRRGTCEAPVTDPERLRL